MNQEHVQNKREWVRPVLVDLRDALLLTKGGVAFQSPQELSYTTTVFCPYTGPTGSAQPETSGAILPVTCD